MNKLYCLEIGTGNVPTYKEGETIIHTDKHPKKGKTIRLDANEKFPYKDNTFDKVYAYNVLEHVKDFYFTVNEIHRVLKREGKLFCCLPHVYGHLGWGEPDHKFMYNSEVFHSYEEQEIEMNKSMYETAQNRRFKITKFEYTLTLGTIFKPIINNTIGFKNYERWIGRTMPLNIDLMFFELEKKVKK